jgi:hypothetical protein
MTQAGQRMICKKFLLSSAVLLSMLLVPPLSQGQTTPEERKSKSVVVDQPEQFKRFEFLFEPDAYYTNVELVIALTQTPIPHVGEKSETEFYQTLLSGAAVLPRYILFEASVNPLPYFGVYLKKNERDFYDNAQLSGSFNWVKALTTGFEEPYAVSMLAGNVISFDVPGNKDIKGNGYSGYLFSAGNYHIKDNSLVRDRWKEVEWKIKGDRKSPIKKLSWSFRIGAKLHGNPDITDIIYLSFRRSRLDYVQADSSLMNNGGFEYTVDLDRRTLNSIRHYFFLDKKWPLENKKIAFTLALGFVWESKEKYRGVLATSSKDNFQFILRPNIEF